MQVETPQDVVLAYAQQVTWLKDRLERLRKNGSETSPDYAKIAGELNWCQHAHDRLHEILTVPKGQWVLVLKSKASGLQGKVGKVTYVNTDHSFATVVFHGDPKPRNLGLGNLEVISLPVPTFKIPAIGMKLTFEGDASEYVALDWMANKVYVEPVGLGHLSDTDPDRYLKRGWKMRYEIKTIEGNLV